MEFYFSKNPLSDKELYKINVDIFQKTYSFYTSKSVFSKSKIDFGSYLLLTTFKVDKCSSVLDLGCGYGFIGIVLADIYDLNVTMVDINERAIDLAKKNIILNLNEEKRKKINVSWSDGFLNVVSKYDVIISNPPIRVGKEKLFSMFSKAKDYLCKDGSLWLVVRKKQGALSTLKYLRKLYREVLIIKKKKGYFVIVSYL